MKTGFRFGPASRSSCSPWVFSWGPTSWALVRKSGPGLSCRNQEKDWILNTATSIKVIIDIFIGIWAFVLAYIWANHIEKREGDKVRAAEIWQRFPKFIIGYVLTFGLFLALGLAFGPVRVYHLVRFDYLVEVLRRGASANCPPVGRALRPRSRISMRPGSTTYG